MNHNSLYLGGCLEEEDKPMADKSSENLKKGIILVFVANLINLVISLLNGFILPKYLAVDTYADIKTYQLYINYIGVLVLGYADGVYLKYGGCKIADVPEQNINLCRSNLLIFQSIITAIFVIAGIVVNDKILIAAAFVIVPINIVATFKNILQATGEFKYYSRIMNYTSVLTFIGTIVLLFVLKTDYSLYYIYVMCAVYYVVWFLMERKLIGDYHYNRYFTFSISDLWRNIKSGFVLMLGNFSSILMTSIDRWFVKFLLSTADFAYYSFVVSTEHLITIFINPIITTMYNYICISSDLKYIKKVKRMCLIFALFLVSSAFPIKFILETYLTKYLASRYVLFILFSTEIFFMIIKGIYVNVYKARKQQDKYFKQLVITIALGCILNSIFYSLFRSNEGIAFATLLSICVWYIICSVSVKEIAPDWKELFVVAVSIITFILCGFYIEAIIGFGLYVGVVLLLCLTLMRSDFTSIIDLAFGMLRKKIVRK